MRAQWGLKCQEEYFRGLNRLEGSWMARGLFGINRILGMLSVGVMGVRIRANGYLWQDDNYF